MIRDLLLMRYASRTEPCFDVGVFIAAQHPVDPSLGAAVGRAVTAGRGLFTGGAACTNVHIHDAENRFYFPEQEPFTAQEAACAFRLPSPPLYDLQCLPVKRSRTLHAPLPAAGDGGAVTLFLNHHHGMEQPVAMGSEDRKRHLFIAGQTGTGKSTMIESMVLQDMRLGRGVGVIDPHGDLFYSILGKIPPKRAKDVIAFDLLDRERPVGFNVLEWSDIYERDTLIDELYLTLDHMYNMQTTGGPIFEANLRAVLKIIMGDHKREGYTATLLDFLTFYQNEEFREFLRRDISDPDLVDFLRELEQAGGEVSLRNLSPYITSKFSRFCNDLSLKRIIGQRKTAFDFSDILDSGKIFLVNLGKGRFGANVSGLLANQLVTRFRLAAMKRGDVPPQQRRDFFLYVDECHNLPGENFMELCSEARKFGLGLVLATQYTSQLKKPTLAGTTLLDAILGNVGAIAMFRLGMNDAHALADILYPHFTAEDLLGLSNHEGYAKMQLNGEALPAFSFKTVKDAEPCNRENAQRMISASRLRYGVDCALVDAEISTRHSSWRQKKECA